MTIFIRIDGDNELEDSEAFPDGVPDVITAEMVRDALEACGSKHDTMTDWCLDYSVFVSVEMGDEVEVWGPKRRSTPEPAA